MTYVSMSIKLKFKWYRAMTAAKNEVFVGLQHENSY